MQFILQIWKICYYQATEDYQEFMALLLNLQTDYVISARPVTTNFSNNLGLKTFIQFV